MNAARAKVTGFFTGVRSMFAEFLGDDDSEIPRLPEGLPDTVVPVVIEGIERLIDYQGNSYAQLYVDRLRRFVGRRDVDDALLAQIARLMALRMSYDDPIRIAHTKLKEAEAGLGVVSKREAVWRFRLDELIGALPAMVAEPLLAALEWKGWTHKAFPLRLHTDTAWGLRRRRFEASLRRWRLASVRYPKERVWVERWLHMIARSLVKQPAATPAIVETATMIQGYGDAYRQGIADWNLIIDGLAKPTFDGRLPLTDLAGAIAEARAAARRDPRQAALKRTIAEIRLRAETQQAVAPSAVPVSR
jgi:hypothetical protein